VFFILAAVSLLLDWYVFNGYKDFGWRLAVATLKADSFRYLPAPFGWRYRGVCIRLWQF